MTGPEPVSVDPALLEVVVCPDCRSTLSLTAAPGGGEELLCQGCALAYPVREGIPVLLVDEAVRR